MMKKINLCLLLLALGFQTQTYAQNNHPFPAAPVFSDLLSSIYLRSNGQFKPPSMFAYFVNGKKGKMKVLRDGTEIAEFSFLNEPYSPPKYQLDSFELVNGKNDVLGFKIKESGKYELVYYANGQKFYSFPFAVTIKNGGDPYKPTKLTLLDGAWNSYAYLYKTSSESHGKWEFRVFMRSDDGKFKQIKGQAIVTNDRSKRVVAVGASGFRTEARWTRQAITLQKPGKKNAKGEYYSNSDFLISRDKFADGSYTIRFTTNGKPYGNYKFSVSGGEIQFQGNQVRKTTDPTRFIEGGGKEIWLKKN